MSNRGDTTPSRGNQLDPRSEGDNVDRTSNTVRVDNIVSQNTPQDRAIIVTDGDNASLRRLIAEQLTIMISNDELLKELHYLRRQVRDHQELRDRVGRIESALSRTHRSVKQPFEEGSQSGLRDGGGHIITPRNLFASGPDGGDDRQLEDGRDVGRTPPQR